MDFPEAKATPNGLQSSAIYANVSMDVKSFFIFIFWKRCICDICDRKAKLKVVIFG